MTVHRSGNIREACVAGQPQHFLVLRIDRKDGGELRLFQRMNDQSCKGKIAWRGPSHSNSLRIENFVQRGHDSMFLRPIARIHRIILEVST